MKPITEEQAEEIHKELTNLVSGYMIWKLRELSGQFPSEVIIELKFPQENEKVHSMKLNGVYPPEYIQKAEEQFLEFELTSIVNAAKRFMETQHD